MKIPNVYTLHDTLKALEEIVSLTPEQQFRVQALIKRHVHSEKADLLSRVKIYTEHLSDECLNNFLEIKISTHIDMLQSKDEEIITWDIGTHIYNKDKK